MGVEMRVQEIEAFASPNFEPSSAYEKPFDVLCDMTLTRTEKIGILHRWLADIVRRETGVPGDRADRVCAVTKALQFLGAPVAMS